MPIELLFLLIGLVPVIVVYSSDHAEDVFADEEMYEEMYVPEAMESFGGNAAALKSDMLSDLAQMMEDEPPLGLTPGQLLDGEDADLFSAPDDPGEEPQFWDTFADMLVIDDFDPDEDMVVIDHYGSVAPELESQIVDPQQGVLLNFSDGSMILLAGMFAVLGVERIAFRELTDAA